MTDHQLIGTLVLLVVIGVALEAVRTKIGIDDTVLWLIRAILVIAALLIGARLLGWSGSTKVLAAPAPSRVELPPPHVTIDTRDKLLSVDTTHLSADYLICVDEHCGFAPDWARVAAPLPSRAAALGR